MLGQHKVGNADPQISKPTIQETLSPIFQWLPMCFKARDLHFLIEEWELHIYVLNVWKVFAIF